MDQIQEPEVNNIIDLTPYLDQVRQEHLCEQQRRKSMPTPLTEAQKEILMSFKPMPQPFPKI